MSALEIADRSFDSRLIIGTGGFRSLESMRAAVAASGAELATVAMRRVDPTAHGSILQVLDDCGCFVLPNTDVHVALRVAERVRKALRHTPM